MLKLTFAHYHDGNDPDHRARGTDPGTNAKWATRARLVDVDTGTVLAETWAFCNPRDNPNRKRGRIICIGRLKTFHRAVWLDYEDEQINAQYEEYAE
jgi:hypothetical protein